MPRESIAMDRQEVLDFLRGQRRLVLGTLDPDGAPWADAAPCVLRGDVLFFWIPRDSRSFANIQRDGRACCALDQYPSYYEIKGATLHGRAVEVRDAIALEQARAAFELAGGSRDGDLPGDGAVFCMGLDDVVSFDFAKIKTRY
ncbi:MAG: pyridoxamine 5'-phosphate oxidase family protein [Dehalococcoidia bacterium]